MTKGVGQGWINILLALSMVMMTVLLMPEPAMASTGHMLMNSGSYTGNGTDNTAITGIGFQPDVVYVKGNTTQAAVVRTSTMSAGYSKNLKSGGSYATNRIKSLDSGGFTIGTDATVNSSGVTYYWVAFKAAVGELKVGSYSGAATAQDITGVGFSPAYVVVMNRASYSANHATSSLAGKSWSFTGSSNTDGITAMLADGFTVSTNQRVNYSGDTYDYIAWKAVSGGLAVGSYTGNNTDNRSITGVGFKPEWVIIQATSTDQARHKLASTGASTDTSQLFDVVADETNRIQALESDGFQLGTSVGVNVSSTYYYIALNQVYNWESYESDYSTVKNTYNGSAPTVYVSGTGFQNGSYLVAYYDGDGAKRGTQTVSASSGTLNSTYDPYTQGGASAGTWHVLVQPSSGYTAFGDNSYATIAASPETYGLLSDDSFTYDLEDIPPVPEMSTFILMGMGLVGLGVYFWVSRRRLVGINVK